MDGSKCYHSGYIDVGTGFQKHIDDFYVGFSAGPDQCSRAVLEIQVRFNQTLIRVHSTRTNSLNFARVSREIE